jgi:ribosome-associated protein
MSSTDPSDPVTPKAPADALALARAAGRLALEKKASDVVLLDLRELTTVCDAFLVASADSEPQIKAVVDHVKKGLREHGQEPWHVEGLENRRWVVLDYVDFVIHVFRADTRETYLLERLWGDAPKEVLDGSDGP